MRIKFLAIIASFLFVSIAISSCLDSDDTVELSSDATVHAFGIDTVYGKYYKFTIDQLSREIYNQDSLPIGADTIIDRILIDTFTVSGWITSRDEMNINGDTIFNKADSVDLRKAVNNETGMKFKVHAPDGVTVNEYTLKIRMHKQDPDSLVWNLMSSPLPVPAPASGQKAVLFNNELWVFTQDAAYKTAIQPDENNKYPSDCNWTKEAYTSFPNNAQLSSLVTLSGDNGQKLYIVTTANTVYSSSNGSDWNEENRFGSDVQALIASFPNILTVITGNGVYTTKDDGVTKESGEFSGTNFPTENIYSTNFESNYQPQVMIVGKTGNDQSEQTVPWVSSNGSYWVPLNNTAYNVYCPKLANPVVMYYGENYYIFGSKEENKLDAIYTSVDGISWRKPQRKFLLDKDMTEITAPYSIVVNAPYIWVIFGGDGSTNAVWRGHLNKLMSAEVQ